MQGVNKVILVGNVGRDPEVRYLENKVPVASFTLATSETYKNKNGERVTNTEWHNIVLWRGLAELAEKYVKKGTALYIEGRLRSRSYDDKEGKKRYVTEIVADNMSLLGNTKERSDTVMPATEIPIISEDSTSQNQPPEGDDLPF